MKKIVLTGGGTAGHVTPNIALLPYLRDAGFEVSYIGYASQAITLTSAQPLKVTLGEDTQVLDEVVVTALGIKRATKALSYNVQEV